MEGVGCDDTDARVRASAHLAVAIIFVALTQIINGIGTLICLCGRNYIRIKRCMHKRHAPFFMPAGFCKNIIFLLYWKISLKGGNV